MERWWDNEAHETTYPLIAQAESNAYNGHDTWDCIINSSDYSGSDTFSCGRDAFINYKKAQDGDWHVALYSVDENRIEQIAAMDEVEGRNPASGRLRGFVL